MDEPEILKDVSYPRNRLAVVVDPENRVPISLLFLSARFGVFRLEQGNWQDLSQVQNVRDVYSTYKYFHVSMNDFKELKLIFSFEDPEYPIVNLLDILNFEIIYDFEVSFWGLPENGPGMPVQLRDSDEIFEFLDGYPELCSQFNDYTGSGGASDWSAHMAHDSSAVSIMQNYQTDIRKIRSDFKRSEEVELFWNENLPQLNSFAENLFKLTEYMYPSGGFAPEWSEPQEAEFLNREKLELYLTGTFRYSTSELLKICKELIEEYASSVKLPPQASEVSSENVTAKGKSKTIDRYAESSTPFGPGSFAFVISPGEIVSDLVVETDFGIFFLDEFDPESPNFPIWTFWDIRRPKKILTGKKFVLVAQKHINSAIELWQKTRNDNFVILRDEHVRPFWEDPVWDEYDDQIRAKWQHQNLFYNEIPFDAKFIIDWAISFAEEFGQKFINDSKEPVSADLIRFANGEISLSREEVATLIAVTTVFHY